VVGFTGIRFALGFSCHWGGVCDLKMADKSVLGRTCTFHASQREHVMDLLGTTIGGVLSPFQIPPFPPCGAGLFVHGTSCLTPLRPASPSATPGQAAAVFDDVTTKIPARWRAPDYPSTSPTASKPRAAVAALGHYPGPASWVMPHPQHSCQGTWHSCCWQTLTTPAPSPCR